MGATTWGLDMSTNPRKTAAVQLSWPDDGAQITDVRHPLGAGEIVSLISGHREETWAVDVPFGWPDQFVDLMADRHERPLRPDALPADDEWETWRTQRVAQRRTDRFLTHDERIKVRPLPASFQLLGATAAMWTLIESRLVSSGVNVDRAGIEGSLCETYPRAAMAGWRYRTKSKADRRTLQRVFKFLTVEPSHEGNLLATTSAMLSSAR